MAGEIVTSRFRNCSRRSRTVFGLELVRGTMSVWLPPVSRMERAPSVDSFWWGEYPSLAAAAFHFVALAG